MTILVLNTAILGVDPVDTGDAWHCTDIIVPKTAAQGATVVDVALPGDFSTTGYTYVNGALVKNAPPPPPVPESISPRQFRQALTHFGFRTTVENAIAAASQDMKDWYEYATSFDRSSPVVAAMAAQLGYTSAQMDQVWTYGAAL